MKLQSTNNPEHPRHDREQKRRTSNRSLRHLTGTTATHSTAAGATLCRWSQGCFPGVLLEYHQLAAFSRVDSENHALLAMPVLLTIEPHRVRVYHSELYLRERWHVFCHRHTDRTNQNSSWTQRRMRDLQTSVEPARKGRTRRFERGLCRRVVRLLEDERDDIAGVGRLVMMQ